MRWLVVESKEVNHFPKWKKTVGISKDGDVFVPAAIAGCEKKVSISTLTKTHVFIRADHVYVPMIWLIGAYPSSMERCWVLGKVAVWWHYSNLNSLHNSQ